jgi:methylmalonyl-CoA mutase
VEELAFALATGVEYIRRLADFDLGIDEIAESVQFSLSLGGNLFMEIAKLRAARQLWSMIVHSFGGGDKSAGLYIHVRTGKYNKTKYDPYVNMLRTTTEAFAGVIGGVDSMHVGCFDEIIQPSNPFSRRIARNQQIILSEESHLGQVIDPAGGSWYIEALTQELVKRAWETFKMLEAEGSMSELIQDGKIQGIIEEVARYRRQNLATRKDVLVGINMYANLQEPVLEDRTPDYAGLQCRRSAEIKAYRKGKIVIEPCAYSIKDAWLAGATLGMISSQLNTAETLKVKALNQERLAEPFEMLRDRMIEHKKRTGKAARVFLANNGGVGQYKARADFSRGFFEVGGFEVIEKGSYKSPSEAGKAAVEAKTEIVVICSTDATYPEIVPEICQNVKAALPEAMLVLAGYPKEQIEFYKESGIDEFIHIKADVLAILKQAQKRAGVE